MAESATGKIYWYDPDPRTIIPFEKVHVPRRLKRTIKQGKFSLGINQAFRRVMEGCAEPRVQQDQTWISQTFIDTYTELHNQGFAHSVETYLDGKLVGGIYGVSIGGFFAGESMFSRTTDASKVALVYLLDLLKKNNYQLFDVQFMTEHLRRFGAVEIPQMEYKKRLAHALRMAPGTLAANAHIV